MIFATTDKGIPWNVKLETVYDNGITIENWHGLWLKYFYTSLKEAFKSLVYTGYCGNFNEAVLVRKYKIGDLLKNTSKNVFNIYVIGHS
jgi:hypothetical protein